MPKNQEKNEKTTFKIPLNKLMEKSLQSLISVAVEEVDQLTKWIKDLSGIGKKIRNLLTTIILFSAGLGVLGIGIALYVNELFPNLSNSIAHMLVGLVIIFIATLHLKLNK